MAGTISFATTSARPASPLPWRGPGGDRPDLPIPPARQPLLHRGLMRKRWRYVGFYGGQVMLCAAVVRVGLFSHTFWSVWDRTAADGEGRVFEHTRLRPGTPEVTLDGPRVEIRSGEVSASLNFGELEPVEVVSPSGRGWGWTRKRAGVPVSGEIVAGGRNFEVSGFGVDDESAGYHARNTAWSWSAGVGQTVDGRALGWNLIEGINDSPTASERAIWLDGQSHEPGPVSFDGLERIVSRPGDGSARDTGTADTGTADTGTADTGTADTGTVDTGTVDTGNDSVLDFDFGGAERHRHDNFGLVRSDYVHRFGEFSGRLGGVELAAGAGVMEKHSVVW